MPVQINEVIIKAVVDNSANSEGIPPATSGSVNTHIETDLADKILEIIKAKKER